MKMFPVLLLTLLAAVGCSKSDPSPGTTAATGSASAAAVPASAAGPAPSGASSGAPAASGSPAEARAAEGKAAWKGSFKTRPGAVTLNKEASAYIKVWAKDPGTEMIGDGTISLQIPATKGPVQGEISGVLGDLLVNGDLDNGVLSARVDAKNPNDEKAMTGVLQGTIKGSTLEATLRVASRNANLVREAELKLSR